MSYSDEDTSNIENYQDAGQSPGVAMEEGQGPDHLPRADGGQSSETWTHPWHGKICKITVVLCGNLAALMHVHPLVNSEIHFEPNIAI